MISCRPKSSELENKLKTLRTLKAVALTLLLMTTSTTALANLTNAECRSELTQSFGMSEAEMSARFTGHYSCSNFQRRLSEIAYSTRSSFVATLALLGKLITNPGRSTTLAIEVANVCNYIEEKNKYMQTKLSSSCANLEQNIASAEAYFKVVDSDASACFVDGWPYRVEVTKKKIINHNYLKMVKDARTRCGVR